VLLSLLAYGNGELSLAAQEARPVREDSVSIRAGVHYEAGSTRRAILGSDYRDLWTAEIQVPLLRPDSFAGGLTLLQRGGGKQTVSLRFRGADQREYVFRSVDKDQTGGLHEDLHGTVTAQIVQDQVSSKHPGGALVIAPLLEAAGVLHSPPTLAVMADHEILGEFRHEFAGMLGMIEERPEEPEEDEDALRRIGTERLLERLEESSEDRVDAHAYLKARLMDLLVGDWDRHPDQWRWEETVAGETRVWLPIPRDRDNAFSNYDGFVGSAGGWFRPNVVSYGSEFGNLEALTHNAQILDRRILPALPRSVWDSIAVDLQSRITDEVIARAVTALPAPYMELNGEQLSMKLRNRRNLLREAAGNFYDLLATEVEVYGTDEVDSALIEHLLDGRLRVRLYAPERDPGPLFDRVFHPSETREVRIRLQGGDDSATVSGSENGAIFVRLEGGGGDDIYDADIHAPASLLGIFDDRGANRVPATLARIMDDRPWEPEVDDDIADNNPPPPRDWGSGSSTFAPAAEWRSQIGPVIGGGPRFTRYGYRRLPFARQLSLTGLVAPLHGRFGVEADLRTVRTGSRDGADVSLWASQISVTRFHGYSNESAEGSDPDRQRIWANRIGGSAALTRSIGSRSSVALGPVIELVDPDVVTFSPDLAPRGMRPFGVAGLTLLAELDGRDSDTFPRRGFYLNAAAEGYPFAWGDLDEPFARTSLTAAAYLPLPRESALAFRLGGEYLAGDAPVQFAAHLGGSSLRGYRTERFTGDASLFAAAELRATLGRANLLIARGDLGVIALTDLGRVFVAGEDSNRWHRGSGGGLWFAVFERATTFHVLAVHGEGVRLSAGLGVPF
jgi:hypothetical protein